LSRRLLYARDLHDGDILPAAPADAGTRDRCATQCVSMVAHVLREAGAIGYSRGKIGIQNLEALRATSCECYDTVKSGRSGLSEHRESAR
jgi:hypothetical protein